MAGNTREASIKLTLDDGAFRSSLAKTKQEVGKLGASASKAFGGPLTAGLAGAKREMGRMGMEMRGMIRYGATLGGAIGFGALIKNAFTMQGIYRNIAFSLGKVSQNAKSWQSVQALISRAVQQTGQSAETLATAFQTVFRGTGNAEFSEAAIIAIGKAATSSGESIETLSSLAGLMGDVFQVSGKDINATLATLIANTGVGDKSLDELGNKFKNMAGEAVAAGMKGSEGFKELLGMTNALSDRMGTLTEKGMRSMLVKLIEGGKAAKELEKKAGVKFKPGASFTEKIRLLLETEKGRKAGMDVFGAGTGFSEFIALVKAGGIEAFDKKIRLATSSTEAVSKQEKEAAQRMKLFSAQYEIAVDKMRTAMLRPEFLGAMNSLTENLPAFAGVVAKVVEIFAKHPILSVLGVGAGRIAGGAAGGAIGAALPKLPGAFKKMMTSTVATGPAGGALVPMNTAAIAANTARTIATWVGGATVAAAVGVAIGTIINKTVLEPLRNKDWSAIDKAGDAYQSAHTAAQSKGTTKQGVRDAMGRLRKSKEELNANIPSFATFATSIFAKAVGLTNKNADEEYAESQAKLNKGAKELADKFREIVAAAPSVVLPETTITSSHRGARPKGKPRPGAEEPFVVSGGG